MHGAWIGLARTVGLDWFRPHWFRFQAAGAPAEFVYAPLVPFLLALFGDPARVLHALTGAVYVLGPSVLFVALWRLLRSPWAAAVATLSYMLLSPTELFLPDAAWTPAGALAARRMYLLWEWDELPHSIALGLTPLLGLLLLRGRAVAAIATAALMMLASAFGLVLTALTAATVALAAPTRWRACIVTPALAWLLASPWHPPSLLLTIRRNSALNAEVPPEARPALAFVIVAVALALTWFATRRLDPARRWLLLFSVPCVAVPVLFQHGAMWFIPQPGRYKVEAELAVALLIAVALSSRRAPVWLGIALTIPLLFVFTQQVIRHRRLAKPLLRTVPVETSIEARTARRIVESLPDQRVMLSGSMAQWANAFADVDQLGGISYPTTPNHHQQTAINAQHWGSDPREAIAWLRRFAVTAVAVPGPKSFEFWRPYEHPAKFEGVLPVVWREDDTTVYAVPNPEAVLPTWRDRNHATLTAAGTVRVAVNALPGWRASRGTLSADEFGLMRLDTGCAQPCAVDLTYNGSLESWLLRALRIATLTALGSRSGRQ